MDCLRDLNGLFNGFERDFKGVLVGFNKGIYHDNWGYFYGDTILRYWRIAIDLNILSVGVV
jgi:hypothetical protein